MNWKIQHTKDTNLYPKLIHRVNTITIKIQAMLFANIDKIILNFIWKGKRTRIDNAISCFCLF